MTVSTTESRIEYAGNGVTTVFAIPFRFLENSHISITLVSALGAQTTLSQGADYTLSGSNEDDGGVAILTTAPELGSYLIILRTVPATQETDYISGDPFPAESHEAALDKLTMLIQQGQEADARTLKFPVGDLASQIGELPPAAQRANSLLAFDAMGRPSLAIPSDQSATALAIALAAATGSSQIGFIQAGAGAVPRTAQAKMRNDYLDVEDYGIVDPTGVVPSTAAVQLAMIAGAALKKPVRLPAGRIATGALTWPNDLPGLMGQGRGATALVMSGTVADYTPLINMSGKVGAYLHDIDIDIDPLLYPLHWGMQITNSADVLIERVRFVRSGSCAIRGGGLNTRVAVVSCLVAQFLDLGIQFTDAAGTNEGIRVYDTDVSGTGTQTSHSIQIVGGGGHTVEMCRTTNSKTGFGVSFYKVQGGHILSNTFSDCFIEGCNLQDSSFCTIIGNSVYAAALAVDFGISIFGDPILGGQCIGNIVIGNTIRNPGKSGIALANRCNNNLVTGNHIYNPNRLNESMGAAVLFYGLGCNSNTAQGNYLFDTSANCKYVTNEWNDGSGVPVGNMFIDNPAFANGLVAEWNTLSTSSRVKALRWKPYTMTVGASSGTLTAYTVNRAEFKPDGDEIAYQFDFTITTNGTAAGALQPTLPAGFPAISSGGVDIGQENGITGHTLNVRASGTGVNVVKYDNTYPGQNGARVVVSGRYRLQ